MVEDKITNCLMKYYTILFLIALTFLSCEAPKSDKHSPEDAEIIQGEAQGTTYSIKYNGENTVNKSQIDSLLREIDLSLSAWVDEST